MSRTSIPAFWAFFCMAIGGLFALAHSILHGLHPLEHIVVRHDYTEILARAQIQRAFIPAPGHDQPSTRIHANHSTASAIDRISMLATPIARPEHMDCVSKISSQSERLYFILCPVHGRVHPCMVWTGLDRPSSENYIFRRTVSFDGIVVWDGSLYPHTYLHGCTSPCMHLQLYVCLCITVYIFTHVCMAAHLSIHSCVHLHVCMHTCDSTPMCVYS